MKVAIVGAHRDSKLKAPYEDTEWEIWSCSPRNENELPRQDVWFEIHARSVWETNREYAAFLATLPVVFMQEIEPDIPGSRVYPIRHVMDRFSPHFLRWTPCYMLALAIEERPVEIGLWGFSDQRTSEGFGLQRLCLQFFIATARREGIRVDCPAYLDVPPKLYGYEEQT